MTLPTKASTLRWITAYRAGYVVRVLEQAALFRGYPRAIRTDGGPEFTSRAFLRWVHARGLIEPGKPTQNAYIESFNGKFRDEYLNEHRFETLAQARAEIATWRRDYNEVRPHSSCNRLPLRNLHAWPEFGEFNTTVHPDRAKRERDR